MIKTEKRVINGTQYDITTFGGVTGLKHALTLVRYVGPALAGMLGSAGSLENLMASKTSDLSIESAVQALVQKLDEQEVSNFIVALVSQTSINGQFIGNDYFNSHFSANYKELFSVLKAVVEVNYGSFLGMAQVGSGDLMAEKTKS